MLAVAKLAFVLAGMAVIPQGTYSPLYATKGAERVMVRRFALDREPVTRGEFGERAQFSAQQRTGDISRTGRRICLREASLTFVGL
jgi:formylglycine-generating enzyme required for sulfatase activity